MDSLVERKDPRRILGKIRLASEPHPAHIRLESGPHPSHIPNSLDPLRIVSGSLGGFFEYPAWILGGSFEYPTWILGGSFEYPARMLWGSCTHPSHIPNSLDPFRILRGS
eukprot:Pompholyxophrys_punicea_v1_NODE_1079_length_982_cov_2.529666.p4 type:complete len:110 gc:universal NODE_1079_length_982_cov_2.529666:338-9(-)